MCIRDRVYGEADRRGEKSVALDRLGDKQAGSDSTSTIIIDEPRTGDTDEEAGK